MILNTILLGLFGGIGGWQLIVVVAVIALLFGGVARITKTMRNVGRGVHAFKQGLADAQDEINRPIERPKDHNKDKERDETSNS